MTDVRVPYTVYTIMVTECSGGPSVSYLMELWNPSANLKIGTWTNSKAEFHIPITVISFSSSTNQMQQQEQTIEARISAFNSYGKSDPAVVVVAKHQSASDKNTIKVQEPGMTPSPLIGRDINSKLFQLLTF